MLERRNMTNLITEAREMLRRAKTYLDATDGQRLDHLLRDGYDARYAELVCFSVAHLSELCDALEKAEEQNKQLMHELYKLACESVGREKALARLEAEVVSACNSVRWIPVSERLPEERQRENGEPIEFNVIISGAKAPTTLCFDGAEWRDFWKDGGYGPAYAVTHWQPLPAAPEKGDAK